MKEFYKLQYKWIRLQHPSIEVAVNKQHPLHQVELDISHSEHIISNLIKDVLNKSRLFKPEDVDKLATTFLRIREQLDAMNESKTVSDYKLYVDRTLELLSSAKATM